MTIAWVAVVLAVVVAILAVGYLMAQRQRRHRLQERFGPEYDRTLRASESRREAEQELREREQRHAELDIKPLAPESRSAYAKKWTEVQERFVDAPGFAVTEADHLVTAVMADRGYPTEGFEQQVSDLSVAHGRALDHYRAAHEISSRAARQEASTEELRQAMVHYRALFEELLEDTTSNLTGRARHRDDTAAHNGTGSHDGTVSHDGTAAHNGTASHDGTAAHDRAVAHDGGVPAARREDVRREDVHSEDLSDANVRHDGLRETNVREEYLRDANGRHEGVRREADDRLAEPGRGERGRHEAVEVPGRRDGRDQDVQGG
ncbi:hypothetical protein Skr01_57440 [Sphaerisporangium krabiense]|uniref:Secreted protein n=1 Tax=Sphaerisporangium krabiense TaxID=763782 RepID=A0A7W8Z8N3_9ACTN|nr:hypothetical protein [Sphaerisporangium krabiense]MBB5629491.1 hypothetical protein [Sphaerisporangium krabiense]GII65659.1 hypothetical protein Skr01_57440 [Sphaerisporangium krabiense]